MKMMAGMIAAMLTLAACQKQEAAPADAAAVGKGVDQSVADVRAAERAASR